jgi:hypothetical protein
MTCALLGAVAAANGEPAALLLAVWIGVLAGIAWRVTVPRQPRGVSLLLATMTLDGEVHGSERHAIVPTKQSARVLRKRPRG